MLKVNNYIFPKIWSYPRQMIYNRPKYIVPKFIVFCREQILAEIQYEIRKRSTLPTRRRLRQVSAGIC